MSVKQLNSATLSVFCESIAVMLSAGVQIDEAVYLLMEDMQDVSFRSTCQRVYQELIKGKSLTEAVKLSGAFPRDAVNIIGVGERSGRLEQTLRSLAVYFDEEERIFAKIKSSVGYPAALLCIMSVILAFTVAAILPVFLDVYENLGGSLAAGSFDVVGISIIIGWCALVLVLICTVAALFMALAVRSPSGRQRVFALLEGFGPTRSAMRQLALSRFSSNMATFVAAGYDIDHAMKESTELVTHKSLRAQLDKAYGLMTDLSAPLSLAQAMGECRVFESVQTRMLTIGGHAGSLDTTLQMLSDAFFEDAMGQLDGVVDNVEPVFAAFLTLAVGATLIAVMLPLIGIMGSIG